MYRISLVNNHKQNLCGNQLKKFLVCCYLIIMMLTNRRKHNACRRLNGGIIFSHSKLVISVCKYTVLYCIIVFSYFNKLIIVTFFITFVQFLSFFNCKRWPMLVTPCLMRNLLCLGLCIAHKKIYKLWPFWFTLTLVLANIKCLSYS